MYTCCQELTLNGKPAEGKYAGHVYEGIKKYENAMHYRKFNVKDGSIQTVVITQKQFRE